MANTVSIYTDGKRITVNHKSKTKKYVSYKMGAR